MHGIVVVIVSVAEVVDLVLVIVIVRFAEMMVVDVESYFGDGASRLVDPFMNGVCLGKIPASVTDRSHATRNSYSLNRIM